MSEICQRCVIRAIILGYGPLQHWTLADGRGAVDWNWNNSRVCSDGFAAAAAVQDDDDDNDHDDYCRYMQWSSNFMAYPHYSTNETIPQFLVHPLEASGSNTAQPVASVRFLGSEETDQHHNSNDQHQVDETDCITYQTLGNPSSCGAPQRNHVCAATCCTLQSMESDRCITRKKIRTEML